MVGHYLSAGAIPHPVVLAGALPTPLESSRSRGWNGIIVEHYRAKAVDYVARSALALVTVHIGPPVTMVQTRCSKTDRRRITKGDITVTPPDKLKHWKHRGRADFAALWLTPALLRDTAAAAGEIVPERFRLVDNFGTCDPQIERLGLALLCELGSDGFGGRLYAESLANALAVHLLRRYSTAGTAVRTATTALAPFKVRRATEYINDNLGRNVALSEIARSLAMSSYHFARAFKQSTGIAPHHYLMECRIERAKSLLRETDLSITEIAHRVGCINPSHFSVLFHRATAMTPRMFRQQR